MITDPFTFHFHSEVISVKKLGVDEFPDWGEFHLPYADKQLTDFNDASLLRQSFGSELFHATLVQLDTGTPFGFCYDLVDNRFFLYFMLQGGVDFSTDEGRPISRPRGNRFYVTHNAPGTYRAHCTPGRHIALAIALSPGWLADIDTAMCPRLEETISCYLNGQAPYCVMPNCRMGKPVHEWLRALYRQYHEIPWVQGSQMMAFISYILAYYDGLVGEKLEMPAYRVKEDIDRNYHDCDLTIPELANRHYVTHRTLIRGFSAEFGINPHQYLTEMRMWEARPLIEQAGVPIKQVYPRVGYRDEGTFRREYRKAFGHLAK